MVEALGDHYDTLLSHLTRDLALAKLEEDLLLQDPHTSDADMMQKTEENLAKTNQKWKMSKRLKLSQIRVVPEDEVVRGKTRGFQNLASRNEFRPCVYIRPEADTPPTAQHTSSNTAAVPQVVIGEAAKCITYPYDTMGELLANVNCAHNDHILAHFWMCYLKLISKI